MPYYNTVIENTKNLTIEFEPYLINPNSVKGKHSLNKGRMTYEFFRESDPDLINTKVTFPWMLRINPKLDDEEMDYSDEIDELFKKRADQASRIIDHQTYSRSPGWYMFFILMKSPRLQRYYGVEMSVSKKVFTPLTKKLYNGVDTKCSLESILYVHSDDELTICNRHGCQCGTIGNDGYTDRIRSLSEKSKEILSPVDDASKYRAAVEAGVGWGIPLEHQL